ncbi:MAG: hypothetical protein KF774_14225 [Planctomyces sp.]|nr:hypothetical protein [Planctomyces sp.]
MNPPTLAFEPQRIAAACVGRRPASQLLAGAFPSGMDWTQFPTLPTLLAENVIRPPALILVDLEWPDQHERREVETLLAGFPASRVIGLAGPWSASLNRSRSVWPIAAIVFPEQLPARLAIEREFIQGRRPPFPLTSGREELPVAGSESALNGVRAGVRRIAVIGCDSAIRVWWGDVLRDAGHVLVEDPQGAIDGLLCDGDPWSAELANQLARRGTECLRRPVVLTDQLEPKEHPAVSSGADVRSKFEPTSAWLRAICLGACLLAVMTGCRESASPPSASTPEAAATEARVEPAWMDQIEAVRSGASLRIATEALISVEDWNELRTGCEALQVLEVPQSTIGDADLDLAEALPNLRRLMLGMPLTDAGAAGLSRWPALSELNLPMTKITDAGLQSLAERPLRQLRLGSPHVTDAGLAALAGQDRLRFLHLIGVPITDAGLESLKPIESLQSLYLDGGRCTEEGLSAFLKARPEIHFHRDQLHLPNDPQAHEH